MTTIALLQFLAVLVVSCAVFAALAALAELWHRAYHSYNQRRIGDWWEWRWSKHRSE